MLAKDVYDLWGFFIWSKFDHLENNGDWLGFTGLKVLRGCKCKVGCDVDREQKPQGLSSYTINMEREVYNVITFI